MDEIIERARGIGERLTVPSVATTTLEEDGDEWVTQWEQYLADSQPGAIERRGQLAGVPPADCRSRLHRRTSPAEPDWAETLDELLTAIEADEFHGASNPGVDATGNSTDESGEETPFAGLLWKLVRAASVELDWEQWQLTTEARNDAERWLLERLARLTAHTLLVDFKTYLADHDESLAFGEWEDPPTDPRQYYEQYVQSKGRLRSVVETYPVLGRLLARYVEQWWNVIETFCERLRQDRQSLATRLGDGELGAVTGLSPHGDPHRDGQQVLQVQFAAGERVAYKPRDVRPEAGFGELANWLSARTDVPRLRTPDCLVRGGYGWMEWIDRAPVSDTAAVGRFFRRAGAVLCLLYATNFVDGHIENLVAAGEYPIVVDLETLCTPSLPESLRPPGGGAASARQNSVLRTGVLPEEDPDSDFEEMAGLDAPAGAYTGMDERVFKRVNTDLMELTYEEGVAFPGESLPEVDGEPAEPGAYVDEIVAGFRAAYTALLADQAAFIDRVEAAFGDAQFRYVYRPSIAYSVARVPMRTPECQRTGRALGCRIEQLAGPIVTGDIDDQMWPLYEAERRALWRGDVPRFSVPANGTRIAHDGEFIVDAFEASPLRQVRRRIEGLSKTDCEAQVALARAAYDGSPTRLAHHSSDRALVRVGADEPGERGVPDGPTAEFDPLITAERLFERVRTEVRRAPDGSLQWDRLRCGDDGVRLAPIGEDLYEGRLGIAVFAAALAAITGDAECRAFATRVADTVATSLDDPPEDVGIGTGVGATVYGYTLLGELLSADRYHTVARHLAERLTIDRLRAAGTHDVVSGTAGGIIALLGVADRIGDTAARERAIVAGEHLLACRTEIDGRCVPPVTIDGYLDRPATGMAHGLSGVAVAFGRLAAVTDDERFRRAAREAIELESKRYDPDRNNWRSPTTGDTRWMPGWCRGRSGVGLSRLALVDLLGDERLARDRDRALAGTNPDRLDRLDHLCCGNCSRIDLLVTADQWCDTPSVHRGDHQTYRARALRLAAMVARRARTDGSYSLPDATDQWPNPSLFQGLSGIGYTFLRLEHPGLPCLTLFE